VNHPLYCGCKEFLENNKDKDIPGIIDEINKAIPESEGSLKTDLRILLNALSKQE
jgi:hypothetical protein